MHRLGCIVVLGSLTACGFEPEPPDATGGPGSTATTAEGTADGADTVTTSASETAGTAETADTEDTEDSPEYPDCEPPDEAVLAQFSVTVDGAPIEIDYSEFHAPYPDTPEDWMSGDEEPEIDGPCQVTEFAADQGTISLLCDDAMGVSRTVELAFSSSPALAPALALDEVRLYYIVQRHDDEIEHEPDTTAHAFALSTDGTLLLAGIDGRFSVYANSQAAWPSDVLTWGMSTPDCQPLGRAIVRVRTTADGENGSTQDGGVVAVGDHLAVVEIASRYEAEADPFFVETARLLVGPPA